MVAPVAVDGVAAVVGAGRAVVLGGLSTVDAGIEPAVDETVVDDPPAGEPMLVGLAPPAEVDVDVPLRTSIEAHPARRAPHTTKAAVRFTPTT